LQRNIHCRSNRKFTKKYSKNEQFMNKTLKDLWKYNKNAQKNKTQPPSFLPWTQNLTVKLMGAYNFHKNQKQNLKHKRQLNFFIYSSWKKYVLN
jgi:hypothetical protein